MYLNRLNKINVLSVLVFILLLGYINPDYFTFSYQLSSSLVFDFYLIKNLLNTLTLISVSLFFLNFIFKTKFKKLISHFDSLDLIVFLTACYLITINLFLNEFDFINMKKNIQILLCLVTFFVVRLDRLNLKMLIQFFKNLIILIFIFLFLFKIFDKEILVFQNSSNALAMIFFISVSFIILFENENKMKYLYTLLSLFVFFFLSSKFFFLLTILFFLTKKITFKKKFFFIILLIILTNNFILPKILLEKFSNLKDINYLATPTKICKMFFHHDENYSSIIGEYYFDTDDFNQHNSSAKELSNWVQYCFKNEHIFSIDNTQLLILNNLYLSFATRYNLFEIATTESLKNNLLPVQEKFSIKKNLVNVDLGNSFHSSYNFLLYDYGIIGLLLIFLIFYYVTYGSSKIRITDEKIKKPQIIFFVCIAFLSIENYIFFNNIICSLFFWSLAGVCAKKNEISHD